jgi:hypothetical protein
MKIGQRSYGQNLLITLRNFMENNIENNTENKNSKTFYYVLGTIVVVALVVFLAMSLSKNVVSVEDDTFTASGASDDIALLPDSTLDLSDVTTAGGAAQVVSISYADALIRYKDKRLQFDTICQAHPNTVTYKDNTGIMIDNRSPVARTIKIGTNYSIKAYGFKIVILPDIYLKSKTLLVDCDKSQNVATILVQE